MENWAHQRKKYFNRAISLSQIQSIKNPLFFLIKLIFFITNVGSWFVNYSILQDFFMQPFRRQIPDCLLVRKKSGFLCKSGQMHSFLYCCIDRYLLFNYSVRFHSWVGSWFDLIVEILPLDRLDCFDLMVDVVRVDCIFVRKSIFHFLQICNNFQLIQNKSFRNFLVLVVSNFHC